ncbi:MAG: zinc ribbon domain-containing protein [Pseudomonas sp.]|uniref:zinc ribbon domain-containing protein n=1 Tax=Pseudomonas sp. TaxID=306 RepID=UPI0030F1E910
MPQYKWTCLACDQSNEAGASACIKCHCPSTPNATEVEAHKAMNTSTQGKKYQCVKCGEEKFEVGESRTAGGILSSIFEVETEKFSFVACARCGFTEFYRCERSALRTIFDFGLS